MGNQEELASMLKEIQQVINSYVTNERVEIKVNIEKNNKTLLISIKGVSDMKIHFKKCINDKSKHA
ncbi:MAG: hypothetical protein ACRCYL_15250 [Kluyvera sp.]